MPSVEHPILAAVAAVAIAAAAPAMSAVTIVIDNADAPGVGFNDPTPVAPVGGNTGTTLGQQRLIAFSHAANVWGATLTSNVPITIEATFAPLNCTNVSAVLGRATSSSIARDFPGAPLPGTWYPLALADKLAGTRLEPSLPQIIARFNVDLGGPDCLPGSGWYYGLDGNEGTGVDLVAVALHELAHGLGFVTFTSGSTGEQFAGFPSVWDHFLLDRRTNFTWARLTSTFRAQSAVSGDQLVWSGPNVQAASPSVLTVKVPTAVISGQAAGPLAGVELEARRAQFGPPLGAVGVTAELMPVVVPTGVGLACAALAPSDVLAVAGKVALIDRGSCTFPTKVKNAQNAGAVGVVIVNNAVGLFEMSGVDPTITIPSVMVSQADGNALKTQLATRSRTRSGVFARIGLSTVRSAGTDGLARPLMYAPPTFIAGSSVSHFDLSGLPKQLMQPVISPDLTPSVQPPQDLTFPLLRDIGW